jgi:hypothetical protein
MIGLSVLSGAIGIGGWKLGVPEMALTYGFFAVLALLLFAGELTRPRRHG